MGNHRFLTRRGETASFPPTLAAVSKKSSSLVSLVLLGGWCLEDQCYCVGRSTLVLVLVGMNQEGSSAGPQYRGRGGKTGSPHTLISNIIGM